MHVQYKYDKGRYPQAGEIMQRTRGVWILGLMMACGGPTDAASAIAAGDWATAKKFLNDANPTVRAATVAAVAATQGAEANKLLSEAVLDSPNADVFKAALPIVLDRALKGDKEFVGVYEKALKSTQQEVQIESIKSLQAKGGSAVKLFTNGFKDLLTDTDAPVVAAAIDAIKTLGEDGWPVVKAALSDPLPSVRTQGAIAAATLTDVSKNHLDDIAKQWVVEEDAEVAPLLQKIIASNGVASLSAYLDAVATVEVASKRADFLGIESTVGIIFKMEPDPKDAKKPPSMKRFCPEIAGVVEKFILLGGKEDGEMRDVLGFHLIKCMTEKDKPDTVKMQAALEKTLKDTAADVKTRGFSLIVLCNSVGLTADTKTWFKGAQKSETDDKVKAMYKKDGANCK
jgi:hypothetical protein